jgi:dolichol-phosphate mannosyltransferase
MFNEQAGAEKCIRAISGALRSHRERNLLIVVNDGSSDRTAEELARVAPQLDNVLVITHEKNRGYGGALRTAALRAAEMGFDYAVFMDSDLTNDPKCLPLFVEKMRGGFDLIKASRYMEGGGVDGVPWWRVWISRAGNAVARVLYGLPLHDSTNGFRAIRTAVFTRMQFEENRFPIIMEELYHAKMMGCSVAEVPNTLTNRGADQRPTSFSYRPSTFYRYLKYPIRARFGRAREEKR